MKKNEADLSVRDYHGDCLVEEREGVCGLGGRYVEMGNHVVAFAFAFLSSFYQRNLGHTPRYPFSRKATDALLACDLVPTGESFCSRTER